jgi:hypothetical protein
LAAPEHSLWLTATKISAYQDPWRRKKTRQKKFYNLKNKKNKNKVPAPREDRNKQNCWTKIMSCQIGKTPCTLCPRERKYNSMFCYLVQGELSLHLRI